jgi:beta-mannosidase
MLDASALPLPWTVRALTASGGGAAVPPEVAGASFAAEVPGCVHTDLMAAGVLPDPYLDANETAVAWVGRTDWAYTTRLPAADGEFERTDLVFDGLDTFAEILVGGRPLGSTANMHRGYRFDVTDRCAAGGTDLEVRFTSAYTVAEARREELGPRPNAYPEPFNYVRKMASSFGWDWGPTLVTAGIWRQVRIERWSGARLSAVRPEVTLHGSDGRVTVSADVERAASGQDGRLRLRAVIAGHEGAATLTPGMTAGTVTLEVPAPALWWPHTLGEARLYDLELLLEDADSGQRLDRWHRRVGFRTIELDTSADEFGSAFTLVVNGVPVFARGVNWIPDDALPSRITPARYRTRLEQAKAANVDLVRVWGGGIYEDEAFYEACDELGLMVWQDFLFACAAYPEEGTLPAEIEAEARENVVRLMPHPSLVLWNGNNENLWGHEDWDWKDELAGRSWGRGYYLGLLPRVVAELDPTRPYWAGSPWSGSEDIHPNDPRHGTTHLWEEWNRRPYTDYLAHVPRFVAEFGWQAPPSMTAINRSVSDRPLTPDSPGMLHHQKAEDGNGKLDRGLAPYFAAPDSFDTWHYLTQLTQARAVATGIEHWRANWPVCSGTVVWQLNDCWPVTSWAAIDGDGRPKPLWYELRRLYADRLLTLQTTPAGLVLAAVNQSPLPWSAPVEVSRVRADGAVTARVTLQVSAAPFSVARLTVPTTLTEGAEHAKEFWTADTGTLRAVHFAAPDKDFAYPAADYRIEVTARPDGARITVTAVTLVRDLLLQADRLAPTAVTDQGRTTLLPGEQAVFTVTNWPEPDARRVPGALFCVNAAPGTSVADTR